MIRVYTKRPISLCDVLVGKERSQLCLDKGCIKANRCVRTEKRVPRRSGLRCDEMKMASGWLDWIIAERSGSWSKGLSTRSWSFQGGGQCLGRMYWDLDPLIQNNNSTLYFSRS
jgi:hypothetical protein